VIVFINSVDRSGRVAKRSISVDRQLGYRATCRLTLLDSADDETGFRPVVNSDIQIWQNSVVLFAGLIRSVTDRPRGEPHYGLAYEVTAADYNDFAERRRVFKIYEAGQTLKAVLQDLHSSYLATFGVTFDPGIGTGPTLGELAFDGTVLSRVLSDLVALADWVWWIDSTRTLRAMGALATPAPFALTSSNARIARIHWTRSLDRYANRIYAKLGSAQEVDKTETFVGNGSTRDFVLTYTPSWKAGYVSVRTYGQPNAANLPLGWWANQDAEWMYDDINYDPPAVRQSTLATPLPTSATLSIAFRVQFPITVTAEDAAEIALYGPDEELIEYPDIYDIVAGQDLAQAILEDRIARPREFEIDTRYDGLEPGQSVVVHAPTRTVNSVSCLITGVRFRPTTRATSVANWGFYTITCVEGGARTRNWRDYWRDLGGGGSGGAAAPVSAGSGASGVSVTSPYRVPFELGGSDTISVRLSGTSWVPVTDYRDVVLDGTLLAGVPVTLRVWCRVQNAGMSVTPRLVRVDTGAAVVTGVAVGTTTRTEQVLAVTLPAGVAAYRLQVQPGSATDEVYAMGRVELY
jgi:hypothetical protein